MTPEVNTVFRQAARVFLLNLERVDAEQHARKDINSLRNRGLMVQPELNALLADLPGIIGFFYRGRRTRN